MPVALVWPTEICYLKSPLYPPSLSPHWKKPEKNIYTSCGGKQSTALLGLGICKPKHTSRLDLETPARTQPFSTERERKKFSKRKKTEKKMFAAENGLKDDPRLQAISDAIRVIPHFPKPGIMFQDITTLLLKPKAFKDTVDIFVDRYRDMGISVVAGIEARGFIFGPPIALALGAKFVPLRKPRKLPGKVISEAYVLEYGTDCLEMHVDAVQPGERAVIIDDLVATGGTLSAATRLLERMEAEVVECACVIGLPEVKGQHRLNGKPLYILVEPRPVEADCC
ncbi:Adenine phosphoribosyltransferase [Bertholletia excelsa]